MLQQFFMVPTFRYAMMAVDDQKEPNAKNNPYEYDDNVLHQIQKMFAFLENTERQDYCPREFCFSFKDIDGNPTNTSIQQDAQEFVNRIFEKLEYAMKETPQKHLLYGVFGGKTCSQIICKGKSLRSVKLYVNNCIKQYY